MDSKLSFEVAVPSSSSVEDKDYVKPTSTSTTKTVTNFMGAPNYVLDCFTRLMFLTASYFLGEPQYYRKNKKPTVSRKHSSKQITEEELVRRLVIDPKESSAFELFQECIHECLSKDFKRTLELIPKVRNEYLMRTSPMYMLGEAIRHKDRAQFNFDHPKFMRGIAKQTIALPTELTCVFQYWAYLEHGVLMQQIEDAEKKKE